MDGVCHSWWSERVNICLQVDEQKLRRDLDEIRFIIKLRDNLNTKFPVSLYCSNASLPSTHSLERAVCCPDVNIFVLVSVCVCGVRPLSLEVTSCARCT